MRQLPIMTIISNCTTAALIDAAASMRGGNLVAFPTETVYGLGADATQRRAPSLERRHRWSDFHPTDQLVGDHHLQWLYLAHQYRQCVLGGRFFRTGGPGGGGSGNTSSITDKHGITNTGGGGGGAHSPSGTGTIGGTGGSGIIIIAYPS